MPVLEPIISQRLRQFIMQNKQEEDLDQAITKFSDELASIIADAIKSATITAPPGSIIVVGGPTTQSNPAPIIFNIS